MPTGLHRYQQEGDDHFITFSCYHRLPYLNTPAARDRFGSSLEATRKRYHFEVLGYVVMPEHVHLLASEPKSKPLANALQALKLSVSKLSTKGRSGRPVTTTSTSLPTTSASRSSTTCTRILSSEVWCLHRKTGFGPHTATTVSMTLEP